MTQYTLVRHSAWTENQDPCFEHAVEIRALSAAQAKTVRAKGGVLFDTYSEAAAAEDAANYHPDNKGLIPKVKGKFVKLSFGELFVKGCNE
jgi:hypothetical protein